MPGTGELILIILLLVVPFGLYRILRGTSRFERLAAKVATRHFPVANRHPLDVRSESRLLPFPISVGILLVVAGSLVVAASAGSLVVRVDYTGHINGPIGVVLLPGVGLLAMLASVIVHWAGAQVRWRRAKYEIFILGLGLMSTRNALEISVDLQIRSATFNSGTFSAYDFRDLEISLDWQNSLSLLAVPAFLFVVEALTGLIARRFFVKQAHSRIVRWNRWIRPIGKFLVFTLVIGITSGWLLLIYVVIRFELKELLRRYPILYFRSFHDQDALFAYSKFVVPVANRYGTLCGLVHKAQPVYALQHDVSVLERGYFIESSEDEWRSWVQTALKRSCLAIVDVSHTTRSIEWELTTALEILGSAKVLLIAHQPAVPEPALAQREIAVSSSQDQPRLVHYSRAAVKETRRAIDQWCLQQCRSAERT